MCFRQTFYCKWPESVDEFKWHHLDAFFFENPAACSVSVVLRLLVHDVCTGSELPFLEYLVKKRSWIHQQKSRVSPAQPKQLLQSSVMMSNDAFPACVLLLGLSKNGTQNPWLQPGQGPEHTACCVPTVWGACVQSAAGLGNKPLVLDTTTWKCDLRTCFLIYLMLNEWYYLYYIDIYVYNTIGNIGNQNLLKEDGFGWLVPFHVCYMTSWHYLERKRNCLYHDYKRNGPRLLWLLYFYWMQNFLCPLSVPTAKGCFFGGLMWALLGGKDLQSELPPSVSCLILQWNCQLEISS